MDCYIGEIRLWAANFAPVGWAFCDGRLLDIANNEILFSLIGTTYGGDGQVNFRLPDLRGRVPVHVAPGYALGQQGGVEGVTLTAANLPAHAHVINAAVDAAAVADPEGAVLARGQGINMYTRAVPTFTMHPNVISDAVVPSTGQPYGSPSPQPHQNMQPFQCINYIICLEGYYPTSS